MSIEKDIVSLIKYHEGKVHEYTKDKDNNTGGTRDYWHGKVDAHRYSALVLKRLLE